MKWSNHCIFFRKSVWHKTDVFVYSKYDYQRKASSKSVSFWFTVILCTSFVFAFKCVANNAWAPGPRVTLHLEKPISLSGLKHKHFRSSPLVPLSERFLLRWTRWHYLSLPSGGFCSLCCWSVLLRSPPGDKGRPSGDEMCHPPQHSAVTNRLSAFRVC